MPRRSSSGLGRTDVDAARQRGQALRVQSRELEEDLGRVTSEWQAILDWFPNWPHPDMPVGSGEEDNVEECAWIPGGGYLDASQLGKGTHSAPLMPQGPPHADDPAFVPRDHGDLGPGLGIDTLQGCC